MAAIDLSTARGQLLNLLRVFDPQPTDEFLQYADLARRCRVRLWSGPPAAEDPPGNSGKPPGKPQPPSGITAAEQRATILMAVGFFGAQPDDARKSDEELIDRLAVILDTIIGRWTSALTQPVGPTGDMSTARRGV